MLKSRTAFGRLACLLLIGIIGLIGLLVVPMIQRAREASARTQCVSQLKQIGIAMHTAVDAHKTLPPVDNQYPNPETGPAGTVLYHLLPFMERKDIHAQSNDSDKLVDIGKFTIPLLLCPWEPTNNTSFAEANYSPNGVVFGNQPGGDYSPAMISDGSSNTLAFAERRGRNAVADIGCWSVRHWKTGAWVDYDPQYSSEIRPRTCSEIGKFNFQSLENPGGTPGASKLSDDGSNAVNDNWHQIHAGGIAVVLMDGGAFFKSSAMDNITWGRVVCPNDGSPLVTEWIE